MNSNENDKRSLLDRMPTKTSRMALQFLVIVGTGAPSLLVFLNSILPDPLLYKMNMEQLLWIGLSIAILASVALSVALVSVVKLCHIQEEKIKSIKHGLKVDQAISLMDEITKINRSL